MPDVHSRYFPPSAAKRWLHCTASADLNARLEERFGEDESEYAATGTKAHALGEIKIRRAIWALDKMTAAKHGAMSEIERAVYPGINDKRYAALRADLGDVPKEMERATDTYCDVVMERLEVQRRADPTAQIFLEQRLDMSFWAEGCFGTSDCVIVSDTLLEIIDYKNGVTNGTGTSGSPVVAEENPQLRIYALGAWARFHLYYNFRAVRTCIVQPNLDSVSREAISVDDLLAWGERVVKPAANAVLRHSGVFHPGDHCHYCAAKAICAARAAEVMKVFEYGMPGSGELSDNQIMDILKRLPAVEKWIKDIHEYTESRALSGERIPGYKLVRGRRPNRKWSDEGEVKAQLLRNGYGPEQIEETRIRTVGEIEKTIGKKAFRALLSGLVHQGEGKLQLVPEDDPRPEYGSADAAFGDLTETTSDDV